MSTKEDEKIKKFISKRTRQSKEYGLRQDDFEEEIFAFIKSYASQKALEELQNLKGDFSQYTWGHYNPFELIDSRSDALKQKGTQL